MQRDWVYQHTGCLRHSRRFANTPGGIAVIVQDAVAIRLSKDQDEPLMLGAGRTLFSQQVKRLGDAMQCHLFGSIYDSDLRLSVALLVRLSGNAALEASSDAQRERQVDAWLDTHTAIALGRLPPSIMAKDVDAPLNTRWRLRDRTPL